MRKSAYRVGQNRATRETLKYSSMTKAESLPTDSTETSLRESYDNDSHMYLGDGKTKEIQLDKGWVTRYLVVTNENSWGKGDTESKALKNARYRVYGAKTHDVPNPMREAMVFTYETRVHGDYLDGVYVNYIGNVCLDDSDNGVTARGVRQIAHRHASKRTVTVSVGETNA